MEKKELKQNLQKIIDICQDGVNGYETAARKVEQNDVRTMLLRLTQQRKLFIADLKNEAIYLGMEFQASGTFKGYLHRVWMELTASLASDVDTKIFEVCMVGEKAAINTYNQVLASYQTPGYIRQKLLEQQGLIETAHVQLQGLIGELQQA